MFVHAKKTLKWMPRTFVILLLHGEESSEVGGLLVTRSGELPTEPHMGQVFTYWCQQLEVICIENLILEVKTSISGCK